MPWVSECNCACWCLLVGLCVCVGGRPSFPQECGHHKTKRCQKMVESQFLDRFVTSRATTGKEYAVAVNGPYWLVYRKVVRVLRATDRSGHGAQINPERSCCCQSLVPSKHIS